MAEKTEYQIGYINGFYAALQSTVLVTEMQGTTISEIRDGILDVLGEMKEDGDLEYVRGGIDEFLAAARVAEANGMRDEFIDFLESTKTQRDKDNH